MESPPRTVLMFSRSLNPFPPTERSNNSGVTPSLSPRTALALPAALYTYQFSTLLSPPKSFAADSSGWTWTLSASEASSHFTSTGKRSQASQRGPMIYSEFSRTASRNVIPENFPPSTVQQISGLSDISQLSPIAADFGSGLENSSNRARPPQILPTGTGLSFR